MSIPYRHKRTLVRVGTLLAALLLIFIVTWLCWVVWLQRYVIYTDDGATLNFELSSYELSGKEAVEPKAQQNISIFYNEGADAIDTTNEMTQMNGYYITSEMFQQDIDYVMLQVERFPSGTPVMIDMKGGFGSFFYQSNLPDAVISASTNIEKVSQLITRLHTKGFYTIARISAFQDRSFGETHVSSGLYMLNRRGLWMDQEGMYWLDPTNATTTSWITSQVLELRDMGFDEVLLDDFCFPNSDQYIFTGDKAAALQSVLPDLRSRLYSAGGPVPSVYHRCQRRRHCPDCRPDGNFRPGNSDGIPGGVRRYPIRKIQCSPLPACSRGSGSPKKQRI